MRAEQDERRMPGLKKVSRKCKQNTSILIHFPTRRSLLLRRCVGGQPGINPAKGTCKQKSKGRVTPLQFLSICRMKPDGAVVAGAHNLAKLIVHNHTPHCLGIAPPLRLRLQPQNALLWRCLRRRWWNCRAVRYLGNKSHIQEQDINTI